MSSDDAPHDYEWFWVAITACGLCSNAPTPRTQGGKIRPGTQRHMASEVVSRLDREAACWGIGTYR